MSASDFSTGAALSFAVRVPEAVPRSATPTAAEVPTDFADVLSQMAPDAAKAAGEPAVHVTERWPAWREKLLQQGSAEPPIEGEGDRPRPAIALAGDQVSAESQPERAPEADQQVAGQPAVEAGPVPVRAAIADLASAVGQPVPLNAAALLVKASVMPPADPKPAPKLPTAPGSPAAAKLAAAAIDPAAGGDAKPVTEAKSASEVSARAQWVSLAVLGRETHMAPVRQPQLGQGILGSDPSDAEPQKAERHVVTDAPASRPLPRAQPQSGHSTAIQPMPSEAAPVAPIPKEAVEQDAGTGAPEPLLPARRTTAAADGKAVRPPPDQAAPDGNPQPEQDPELARSEEKHGKRVASTVEEPVAAVTKDVPRAPLSSLMPAQQIAGRVVAAAMAAQQEVARVDRPSASAASAPLVKVLYLQLQPEDLGTITIRMSLKQDALDIRIEASSGDTAGLLQRDQETLAKLIASAGYRVEGMTVSAGSGDSAQLADGRSSGFSQSMSGQSNSSQSDARSSGGRDGAPPDPRQFRGAQNGDGDTSSAGRNAGGDLYV